VRAGAGGREVLSRREREVVPLVAEGLSNAEIARRLFVTPKTVEHHVTSILGKLGLRTRAEVAAWAMRHTTA
jgi:DNA-binding NarL/FixJ family response regulator